MKTIERVVINANEWKDADVAFNEAIASNRLSANQKDENFAGYFMYMGPGKGGDAFKNINTREYIN